MTMPSGAHIKIGSYEFLLDETIDAGSSVGTLYRPHYALKYNSLFNQKVNIAGSPTKEGVRPERMLWFVDDWSGGENNRTWEQGDPLVYNYSLGINTRIRGQLTGRPSRTTQAVGAQTSTTFGDVRDRPVFAVSQGAVWLLGGNACMASTTTGTTWTRYDRTAVGLGSTSTEFRITAAVGSQDTLYYAAYFATTGTNTGTRILKAKIGALTADVQASATGKYPYAGLAWMQGQLYAWTGATLFKIDVTDPGYPASPVSAAYIHNVSGQTGIEVASSNVFGTTWWANCVATEHSVVCFYTTDGQSDVYEYDLNGGGFTSIWHCPYGLSIKAMKYNNGVLYFSGHWGGDSNMKGFGVIYGMNLQTKQLVPIDFVRRQNQLNLEMQEMAASYGDEILVAASHTGRIMVYDANLDSLSMLDTMPTSGSGAGSVEPAYPQVASTDSLLFVGNDHRIGDMITYGLNRFAVVYRPGSASASDSAYGDFDYRVVAYADDEPYNRQAATTSTDYLSYLYEGTWDYDVPFEQKMLIGFDLTYAPLTTGQSIFIEYSKDGGAFVTASEYTSAGADAAKGRTFIDLTSTTSPVDFYELTWRVGVRATGNGILPPIVKGVCAEAQVIAYDITFNLLIRVKDAQTRTRSGKSATMQSGKKPRDFLKSIRAAKTPVTFLDGYVSHQPGIYDTYKVTIEDLDDVIVRPGEGTMMVSMRTVPV